MENLTFCEGEVNKTMYLGSYKKIKKAGIHIGSVPSGVDGWW